MPVWPVVSCQKEVESHQKKMKGGPFKLNSHPKDYFQENPFKADRGARVGWKHLVHSRVVVVNPPPLPH